MSEPISGAASAAPLQFDTVEPATPTAAATAAPCTACQSPITDAYYQANAQVICPRCRDGVQAQLTAGGSFAKALVFGAAGGALGAAVWYGIYAGTGYQIGLISILAGWLVGQGIRRGAPAGGRGYQFLALFLAYASTAAIYVPEIVSALGQDAAANMGFIVLTTAVAPVLVGFDSPILLLIAGLGLWEAWKLTARAEIQLSGPYRIAQAQPEGEPAVV